MYKILIVEDEKDTAIPVKEYLELENIKSDIASDGELAVKMFNDNDYDLVLLDLNLPKLSGKEVLLKLRKQDPYVIVIVYTCYEQFIDIKELVNIGIDGYINKGHNADLDELITVIKGKLDPLSEEGTELLLKHTGEIPQQD